MSYVTDIGSTAVHEKAFVCMRTTDEIQIDLHAYLSSAAQQILKHQRCNLAPLAHPRTCTNRLRLHAQCCLSQAVQVAMPQNAAQLLLVLRTMHSESDALKVGKNEHHC